MFHKGSCSARRLLLFLAALTMLLLPLSAYAEEETPDAEYEETKVIPGYEENAYGYQYTGVATIVTIPSEITEMNRHMFYNNNAVRAIVVPATVAYVSDQAIANCRNLRYVCFLSGSTRVKNRFIQSVPSLTNISAPKGSAVYNMCVTDHIPVTTSRKTCFSRKKVYLLPKDTQMMPLFNAVENVTYSSSNKKIASVTKKGKVKGKKRGTAVITAVCGDIEYQYKVTVYSKTESQRVKQIRKSEKLSSAKLDTVARIKAVHDWMIRNVRYDYDSHQKGKIPGVAHTSQGSLIRKLCVCDGYAYGFQVIMKSLHIPCRIVEGSAGGETHTWNMVRIGSKWYHVDVTWDDPLIGESNHNTIPDYRYFLKSTKYMQQHSHKFKEKKYPKCTSTKYDKKGLTSYTNAFGQKVSVW